MNDQEKIRRVKFVLINPTADFLRAKRNRKPRFKNKYFRFSMLPSLYVVASMPDWVESRIVDEDIEPIDFDIDADIIGLTLMSAVAPRGYEIADRFRKSGKTVILGGYHPSSMIEEALQHCDSICVGEAESNVPTMMEDWRRGQLKKVYDLGRADLRNLPLPPRGLIHRGSYVLADAVQATRGCANRCSFCTICSMYKHQHRTRPVSEVVREVKGLGRYIMFVDDNLTYDREYAIALFKALTPLKKTFFGQTSITIAYDDELLKAAVDCGFKALFMGLESLSKEALKEDQKGFLEPEEYPGLIKKLHENGIMIMASVVFGHDNDTKEVFDRTLRFLLENNVDTLQATVLTPLPGSDLFDKWNRTGRIVDRDWTKYDYSHVVFEPKLMTKKDLEAGHGHVLTEFYSWKNILKRGWKMRKYTNIWQSSRLLLGISLSYRQRIKAKGFDVMASGHASG